VKRLLQELKWAGEDQLKALEKAVRDEISDAVKFAEESPEPGPDERDADVFAP
jgi:pyruvate dehydrogenase E1 component alpha subunit